MLPDGDGLNLTRELRRRDPAVQGIVITAYGSVRKAMEATKGAGAFHVLEKPFDPDELLGLVRSALDHRRVVVENTNLRRRLADRAADSEILGQAPGIQRVLETVAAVADADANVLIIGESGTGKELVADALHERSRRRGGPWVKINCAALPKDLIESELFGHTRGAFTGATSDKAGLLEEADGGSLLLDEITEMPVELQAKLLRVLEERAVRRVGTAKAVPVDFRLISSTNRSPEAALRVARKRPRAPECARAGPARDARTADHARGLPRAAPARGRRARCRAGGRALGGARRVVGGDRAGVDPARARDDEVEQAGRRGAARVEAPDALLQDAQARHPAAPAVVRSKRPICVVGSIAPPCDVQPRTSQSSLTRRLAPGPFGAAFPSVHSPQRRP